MDSTVTPTPPKFPQDFTVAHFLDRIGRNPAEVDGDDAKVDGLLRKAAHQPDVAALQPDLARPGLDAMAGSALGEIGPSLGKRASRGLVRFLIVFSIGVGTTLAWQWYGDAARAMIATSWPQLASLAPETASVLQAAPEQTAAAPQATASPELQQLKEIPAALASLRQSMDRLAGSQQQIAGTIAKLGTQKPASPPRPAPAPAPKPLTPPQ